MTPWCDCPDECTSGHVSLQPVADVWVHGKCLRPSYAWWKAHEDFCFECGRSFSSPVADVCQQCADSDHGSSTATWAGLAALWKNYWQEIFGKVLTDSARSG